MIEINSFLKKNLNEVKNIIAEFDFNKKFSSHDFIEKFTLKFESDYIDMLVKYQKHGEAFQKVHSIIAKFLSSNMSDLRIKKTQIKGSENIHGKFTDIQWWIRITE